MSKRAVLIGMLAFVLITSWNSLLFLDWRNPFRGSNSDAVEVKESKLWRDIKQTRVDETDDRGLTPIYSDALIATKDKIVDLSGVGFLLKSGVHEKDDGDKEVTEFMLLPGNGGVAWCCGLTAIPEVKYSVLVECNDAPFPITKVDPLSSSVFVNVKGTLRLQKDNSIDAIYVLENSEIEFVGIEEVLPPNVVNQCLNTPMLQ